MSNSFLDKFSFDFPDLGLGDKFMRIGDIIRNFIGGLLPDPDSFIGGLVYAIPGTDDMEKMAIAFKAGGQSQGGEIVMPGGGNGGQTQELKDAASEMNASTGDVIVIDESVKNSTTSTTSDTYNQQELSSDHKESSGSWWSRVDLTPWN